MCSCNLLILDLLYSILISSTIKITRSPAHPFTCSSCHRVTGSGSFLLESRLLFKESQAAIQLLLPLDRGAVDRLPRGVRLVDLSVGYRQVGYRFDRAE